jgi:hypothetical protein
MYSGESIVSRPFEQFGQPKGTDAQLVGLNPVTAPHALHLSKIVLASLSFTDHRLSVLISASRVPDGSLPFQKGSAV